MAPSYAYDAEFARAFEPIGAALATAPKIPVYDALSRRKAIDQMWSGLMEQWPEVSDVEETIFTIPSFDGAEIKVHRFVKAGTDSPGSAVVYIHGGGYICLSVALYRKKLQSYVTHTGVPFFAVEYRLAPEHVFPTPTEDCYAGLSWVISNADSLQIDPTRVAIMGDSAGGGLAAGTALMARDRALSPPLSKQFLINAMLDDRNGADWSELDGLAIWSADDNRTGWAALLGRLPGQEGSKNKPRADEEGSHVSIYASPARVPDVAGLPPLYLDVPGLDIFRDEDLEYARRHAVAGIPTELHLYPGLPHSFESFAPGIQLAKAAWTNRVNAIRRL